MLPKTKKKTADKKERSEWWMEMSMQIDRVVIDVWLSVPLEAYLLWLIKAYTHTHIHHYYWLYRLHYIYTTCVPISHPLQSAITCHHYFPFCIKPAQIQLEIKSWRDFELSTFYGIDLIALVILVSCVWYFNNQFG